MTIMLLTKDPLLFAEEKFLDFLISKFSYAHDVDVKKLQAKDLALYNKHLKKVIKKGGTSPRCISCTFYRPLGNKDYGTCTIVGAKNKKPGQQVFYKAWCSRYSLNSMRLKKAILSKKG